MRNEEGAEPEAQVACRQFPVKGAIRIARRDSPLALSWISVADAEMPFSGNRYDVPGGGILYCATNLEGCYAETLARYRPSPGVIAALGLHADGYMNVGSVPADWRLRRVKTRVLCQEPLPFVDVENPRTLATLGEVLAKDLAALDIEQPLDVSLMRGRNRHVPRLVSRWAYVQQNEDGTPRYSGIRYESKLGGWECWAIFDGTPLTQAEQAAVSLEDPELVTIASMYKLTIH
ncbi:MAG: RES domain-containing protein [Actinomycetales bacterium]|nr:RES domain-containing protein [Actinomycetales bacterium]